MSHPLEPGRTFRDCPDCPEMVVVPAGSFQMGSAEAERAWVVEQGGDAGWYKHEQPRHRVTIGYDLAVSRREITRGEFARFAQATGHKTDGGCYTWTGSEWKLEAAGSWRSPGFEQTDAHPVTCVSWQDASAFVRWLDTRSAVKGYRLPSEAEWEYAARARSETFRYWGDDRGNSEACAYANATDQTAKEKFKDWSLVLNCRDGFVYTAETGRYKANAFGLFDMLGNVWEWVEDCYHDSYTGAPPDGKAWTAGDCSRRVQRGGSWLNVPSYLRSANRLWDAPEYRFSITGFRVARALTP